MEQLLTEGADATAPGLVAFAVRGEEEEVVRILLEGGADPEDSGTDRSPHAAIAFYRTHSPLQSAVEKRNLGIAELLLQHGADPNAYAGRWPLLCRLASDFCRSRCSPVQLAKELALLSLLIRYGAEPDIQDVSGRTPLSIAFERAIRGERQPTEFGRALVKHGVRPDSGFNPLFVAATYGAAKNVRRALNFGVPVNGTLPDGRTALHVAAGLGLRYAVRALLQHGANPLAVDAAGRTPLDAAKSPSPDPSMTWWSEKKERHDYANTLALLTEAVGSSTS